MAIRGLIAFACVVLSIASLWNVFADNSEVVAAAKEVACPKGSCSLVRLERSPFAQSFAFRTSGGKEASVRCARAQIFFGDYECTLHPQ